MAVQALGVVRARAGWLMAMTVLARAAVGLFVHGIARPGAPATVSRTTGRVVRR